MKSIPAYQQRVLDEQSELNSKLKALEKFLLDLEVEISDEDHDLLKQQLFVMLQYNNILKKRIDRF